MGVPYLGVLTIRILLSRVLYWDPLFLETPTRYYQYGLAGVPPLNHRSGARLRSQHGTEHFGSTACVFHGFKK